MPLIEPVELLTPQQLGRVHFIAVGGAGMSGIAAAFAELGIPISGCDQNPSESLRSLASTGLDVAVGHDPAHLADVQTVVYSSAIRPSNPERMAAESAGLRLWHRSAALGSLMLGRRGVAVTGTHGKTTTSGMIAQTLAACGRQPSYVIGSPLSSSGRSAHLDAGEAFVVEADESDGSFLQYPAEIAVVTNIEADHLDNWGTAELYREGFVALATAPAVRTVVLSADDPGTIAMAAAVAAAGKQVVTFGEAAGADVRISNLHYSGLQAIATLEADGDRGEVVLQVPGHYNLLNAAAAYAVGRALGVPGSELRAGLATFAGTHRRFQFVGEVAGARIYDDYAHHPTEVRALLTAARALATDRVVACFQPHLFSRTRDFAVDFGQALALADRVVVLDVYPAREDPIPGVSGQLVADAAAAVLGNGQVSFVADKGHAPTVLRDLLQPGDLVLTIGAGDITAVGPAVVAGGRA